MKKQEDKPMLSRIRAILPLAIVIFAALSPLAGRLPAQSMAATISGTVKDQSGASVPDAKVDFTNRATNQIRSVQTNESGLFVLPDIEEGAYDVSVGKAGFKKLIRAGIAVNPQDRLSLGEMILQVGAPTDSVTITADPAQLQLQADSGERSAALTGNQLRDIALNGRNIHDLAKIIPGVAQPGGANEVSNLSAIGSYSINGTRVTMKDMSIDGSSVTRTDQQAQQITINPDAVSEVKILTSNYQAEFGKAGGGIVTVTTKGGSQDFHADARWFHRNDSLNANSYFNNLAAHPRALYRYNYYGFDVSGPIYLPKWLGGFNRSRNKLFFFYNEEWYNQLTPQASAINVEMPTAAERNGDFSQSADGNGKPIIVRDSGNCLGANGSGTPVPFPGNIIPKSCFFPGAQAVLNLFPMPNTTIGGSQYNYTSQISSKYPRREDIVRIDYMITDKHRLSGRFINNYDDQILTYGTTTLSDNFPTLGPANRSGSGYNMALTLTSSITPTLINEAMFGHGIFVTNIVAATNGYSRAATGINTPLLFPQANAPYDIIPSMTFGGLTNQTSPSVSINGSPFFQQIPSYNVTDNVTKIIGKHTIKTGIYYYKATAFNTPQSPAQASVDYTSSLGTNANFPLDAGDPFANALLGVFTSYTQASQKVTTNSVYNTVEGYVQDTWRITPHLTLDYGLRLSYLGPVHDLRQQEGYFEPNLFNPQQAVRLYTPVLVNGAVRVVDPASVPATPTTSNTLPSNFEGLIVPNSGSPTNGLVSAKSSSLVGGYSQGVRFGPRLGFAWEPLKDTVVRGGFGISYDRSRTDQDNNEAQVPPNVLTPVLYYGSLANINAATANGARGTIALTAVSPADKTPSVYSYSLGIQRHVGFGIIVDAAFVGSLGRNLEQVVNLNAVPYGATFLAKNQDPTKFPGGVVPSVQPNLPAAYSAAGLSFNGIDALPQDFLRPFPGYGDILYRNNGASSNYNSLQLSVSRRMSRGLMIGAAYTYSKNFVTNNSDSDSVNPFNTRAYEYRLAASDQTNNLVVNYIYNIPGAARFAGNNFVTKAILNGWEFSGISIFRTGTPVELSPSISGVTIGAVTTGSYTFGPLFYATANPLISNVGNNGDHINASAFYLGQPGELAPWPRTYLRNPGTNNFDLSLFKNFQITGDRKKYLQLRLEAFNAFNHTQFSGYNLTTNMTTSTGATGTSVLNVANFSTLTITNNLRPAGSTKTLGSYFGEYNGTREQRIVQIAAKFYF
jgi:hypothetical protein